MYCKKCNNKAFNIKRNDGDLYYCENCKEIKESDVDFKKKSEEIKQVNNPPKKTFGTIDKGIEHLYIGRKCKVGDLINELNESTK